MIDKYISGDECGIRTDIYVIYNDKNEIEITVGTYTFIPDLEFMNEHAVCKYCGQIYIWEKEEENEKRQKK